MKPFFVYLLRCGDGSYYAGHTDDLAARLHQHETTDTGYTAKRKPVALVWHGEFETREGAIAFEQQVKGWSRGKKEALISGDWERIQVLAQSKNGLRQAQPERVEEPKLRQASKELLGEVGLRQAQPERAGGFDAVNPSPVSPAPAPSSVPPGPVEGLAQSPAIGAQPPGPEESLPVRVLHGNPPVQRRAMAKAITLLESTRADHRALGDELLTALLPHTGRSFRLGISGVPGVGKSTFIEALGLYLIGQGHRVAVLAVDPSSSVSGGSILGDKTRMEHLSVHEKAYIRPSPSSGTLGGVAEKTREAMLVCESAGYDVVIVETVGVGQSETSVHGMTDMFCLLQLPNAGDDLQAIKKGVMELADLVVINKADIDPDATTRARAQIMSSLRLLGLHGNPDHMHHDQQIWHPQVIQISALHGQGVDTFWSSVSEFRRLQTANGRMAARRQQQATAWMWERIDAGLKQRFRAHPQVREKLDLFTQQVQGGQLAASTAARQLLDLFE